MTTLACWLGVDSRGPASLYIAADSRITWGADTSWDQGRKVFACVLEPHVFGYVGDVLFPALAIPTVIELIDRGVLAGNLEAPHWHRRLLPTLRSLWSDYPVSQRRDFALLHAVRSGTGLASTFSVGVLAYRQATDTWSLRNPALPTHSATLEIAGSGAPGFGVARATWNESRHANTSRAQFSALCDAIDSGADPMSGGTPQLVGLYRKGAGRSFGLILERKRYLAGHRLVGDERVESLEWRNELFERMDPTTRRRLPGAARHGRD
jgi:hypothetical protein